MGTTYQIEQREKCWLYFEECDRADAESTYSALDAALNYNREHWGLPACDYLHVVIMTGWWSYMMAAAPITSKPSLILLYPMYAGRVKRTWKFAGGWQNRFGRRRVVGIKPARLIEAADRTMGKRVYVEVEDLTEKLRQIVYHEITHACSAHLRLPAWLNEGLAMLTVDGILGRQTVKTETLDALGWGQAISRGVAMRNLDPDYLVANYVRGYWITRFYDETRPELLPSLLKQRMSRSALETALAQAAGLPPERFWAEIEGKVKVHFQARLMG